MKHVESYKNYDGGEYIEFGLKLLELVKKCRAFSSSIFVLRSLMDRKLNPCNDSLNNSCFFLKLALGFSTFSSCVNNMMDVQRLNYCMPLCCSGNSCISAFIGRFTLIIELSTVYEFFIQPEFSITYLHAITLNLLFSRTLFSSLLCLAF